MTIFLSITIALLMLIIIFALGPREKLGDIPEPVSPPAQLTELDAWLAKREATTPHLREGCAKRIRWQRESEKTRLAIIYLHGFSASADEVSPLCQQLADRFGANLYFARLAGHGQDGSALASVHAGQWIADMREAISIGRCLGERLIVIGTSTGATLAMLEALEIPHDIIAFALLSPNFRPRRADSIMLTWPWARQLLPRLAGSTWGAAARSKAQSRVWTTEYPTLALLPMAALVKHVCRQALERICTPIIVLYSPLDKTVNPASIEMQFKRFGSEIKQLITVEGGGINHHVIAGDIAAPKSTAVVANHIYDFIITLLSSSEYPTAKDVEPPTAIAPSPERVDLTHVGTGQFRSKGL